MIQVKTQSPRVIGVPLRLQQVQDGLVTRRLGKPIYYFSQIDSTNSYARRLAEQGADQGGVIVAEAQTRGRGRLGRSWVSPPFLNLYCSVDTPSRAAAGACPSAHLDGGGSLWPRRLPRLSPQDRASNGPMIFWLGGRNWPES